MAEETVKALLNSGDKRHSLYVNAFVCVATAAFTGGSITFFGPKAASAEDIRAAIQESLQPIRIELLEAKQLGISAKALAQTANEKFDIQVAKMVSEVYEIGKTVARIDERTRKVAQ